MVGFIFLSLGALFVGWMFRESGLPLWSAIGATVAGVLLAFIGWRYPEHGTTVYYAMAPVMLLFFVLGTATAGPGAKNR